MQTHRVPASAEPVHKTSSPLPPVSTGVGSLTHNSMSTMEFPLQPEKTGPFEAAVICPISDTYFRHHRLFVVCVTLSKGGADLILLTRCTMPPFPKTYAGKLPNPLTSHLLCQPHALYISISGIFLPSCSEQ